MKVTLKTAQNDFVHETEILDFDEFPAVIVWGTRVFILAYPGIGEYRECFCYVLPADRPSSLPRLGGLK
jgi:hypothetical protein